MLINFKEKMHLYYPKKLILVNTVQWAPSEFGLIFACGSSDGSISIVTLNGDGNWSARKIDNAHPVSF